MNLQVLLKVGSLSKLRVTTRKVAGIRFVVRVNTEVVEEVVPLVEYLVAVLVRAEHLLGRQLGVQTLVLKDNEVVHVWNLLLYLHKFQVEFTAQVN